MPKKFQGQNSKAVEAKQRKNATRTAEELQKQKELEDAMWVDDDKYVNRKSQRREDRDKKRVTQLEHKKELAILAEKELEELASASRKNGTAKLTRAQIAAQQELVAAEIARAKVSGPTLTNDLPLEENVNRVQVDGLEARDVDEAIALLSVDGEGSVEHHPEKRMAAAYSVFEQRELARLKLEFPNLRLSQLKQMLKKEWLKSPENPYNQRIAAYNEQRGGAITASDD